MCFVLSWEQTATCATYRINWLVFITKMKSVYSAVWIGALNRAVCHPSWKGKDEAVQQVTEFMVNRCSVMSQKAWNPEDSSTENRTTIPLSHNLVPLKLQLLNLDRIFNKGYKLHTKLQIQPQYAMSLLTWPPVQQLSVYKLANAGFLYDTWTLCNIKQWDRI